MKIELSIESIKNGYVVTYKGLTDIWEDQIFFKTFNQAIVYCKKFLDKEVKNG